MSLAVSSPPARAQTLPMPALPPEEPPADTTGPDEITAVGPAAREVRPPPWELGLGFGVGYDSNIDFLVPDGPSSWAMQPWADVTRVFSSRSGDLRLGGSGRWVGYPDRTDLSRYYADASLDGNYRTSPATSWRVTGHYDFGHSDSIATLSAQGVLLPLVKTQSLTGGFGMTHRFGQRTSLRLDGRIYRTEFDRSDPASLGLVDGQSIRGTVGLEQRLGPRDTLAIEYSLESALARNVSVSAAEGRRYYLTHYGSLQWTRLFSPRSGLLLEGGASYTPDYALAELARPEGFFGGATFSRLVKRSRLAIFARREVTPAFGLGVSRVDSRFGLDIATPMGRAWRLALSGTYTRPETPEGAAFAYGISNEALFTLGRRLGRYLELSAEGRYRWRGAAATFPQIQAYQAGLFVSLIAPWRTLGFRYQ
ncbi:MAG TPA: outer membrane beta-barrel protein [Vicinamibacteria bacterium]|nr:outer membrane beta-barrel protein [Vicinamibacteria bacterium]